ncbi:MAG: L-2-hydroxyglutarate oxidase [Leptospiraceae bacterium]|nr:L-2-hydroxyglutarate oxidase [Leptospiraceae bacterium]MDW7975491.1 L-2-hydroxyglutarate oxidase [Leptospiraceae bacterium]
MQKVETDFLVIGAGIIGLVFAKRLKEVFTDAKIIIIDKENDVALHASSRNSGVLHAGFYYSPDSLKAKLTKDGNLYWKDYCLKNHLPYKNTQKVVVTKNEDELKTLWELYQRGNKNQVPLKLIDEKELKEIEPKAKTFQRALYSPLTGNVDPKKISFHLKEELSKTSVLFLFSEPYITRRKDQVITKNYQIKSRFIINAAGLYADRIAKGFGVGKDYTILPFKGLYLEAENQNFFRTNIYPVPDLNFPFLGVHFTITIDDKIKIGPTAIPAFWREQYSGFENFRFGELLKILYHGSSLFLRSSFEFRSFAAEEIKKYNRSYLLKKAMMLVSEIPERKFRWGKAGIRAQLLNKKTLQLVNDFVVEQEENSIHVLNAVSPAFTAAYPFAKYVIEKYIRIY